jgi:mRNA interferase MazF
MQATLHAVRRGEVWWVDVPSDKRRPVLVLSRNPMGSYLNAVICAPITSNIRGIPTEVLLDRRSGLARASVANLDNTTLVDRRRFIRRLGEVPPKAMEEACRALAFAVGCRF